MTLIRVNPTTPEMSRDMGISKYLDTLLLAKASLNVTRLIRGFNLAQKSPSHRKLFS
jgi:hypothetical protein